MSTDASVAGLKSNNIAICGRKAYTTARITTKSNADDRICNRSGTATTAAASNFGRITGIGADRTLQMFKEKIFEQEEGLLDNEPFLFRVKEPMPNSSITVFAMGTAPASRSRCTAVALKKGLKFDRIRELQGAESVRRI